MQFFKVSMKNSKNAERFKQTLFSLKKFCILNVGLKIRTETSSCYIERSVIQTNKATVTHTCKKRESKILVTFFFQFLLEMINLIPLRQFSSIHFLMNLFEKHWLSDSLVRIASTVEKLEKFTTTHLKILSKNGNFDCSKVSYLVNLLRWGHTSSGWKKYFFIFYSC